MRDTQKSTQKSTEFVAFTRAHRGDVASMPDFLGSVHVGPLAQHGFG